MSQLARLGIGPSYLLLCLLLGGASAAGYWANMALQLVAIGIIAWAMVVRRATPLAPPARQLIFLVALIIAVPLLQLVPLPPAVWTALPGREEIANAFRLLRQPLPWMPASLAPASTLSSLLWLLPSFAIALGIVRLGSFKAVWIGWVVVAVAGLSVAVGALQIAGGGTSPYYFYRITNYGFTTGFFANANHMATLLVVSVPFLTALYLHARDRGRSAQAASGMFVMMCGALAVILVGVVINTSLAGIGLMVPATAASLLMIFGQRRKVPAGWSAVLVALLMAGAVTAIYYAPITNNLTSSDARSDSSSRYISFSITGKAAADFFPAGSGIGTFQEVYRSREDPAEVNRYYMNHAHGDYLELALETGLPGTLVLLLFLSWWARRTVSIWKAKDLDHFAMAATIASGVILAHSIVDYPLRTAAISGLFAACCALMAEPRPRARAGRKAADTSGAKHLSAD